MGGRRNDRKQFLFPLLSRDLLPIDLRDSLLSRGSSIYENMAFMEIPPIVRRNLARIGRSLFRDYADDDLVLN